MSAYIRISHLFFGVKFTYLIFKVEVKKKITWSIACYSSSVVSLVIDLVLKRISLYFNLVHSTCTIRTFTSPQITQTLHFASSQWLTFATYRLLTSDWTFTSTEKIATYTMKLQLTERLSSSQTSKLSIIQVTEKISKAQSISNILLEVKK